MGLRTIAVYSEADANALHVRMADETYLLGPAPASDSYLRAGRILSVAKQAGADAIHPGYGFLSENADFAELTKDAGMIFVGPPADAIRAMGLKDKAKEIMSEAGVPVVPGYHGRNQSPEFLKRKAYEIGYPVLIKAVAGGGGKGMRKVLKALEFDDALEAAKREAKAAFGNDIVLIEKFVESPRHIEIQVFGDSHGNVVHLFERDCSLQRRHQKVIEEAPAPGMSDAVREAMGKAACDAAIAVGYEGAGTVEFIVDGANGLTEDGFYFMEMNTRLQVEHPVTEMITDTDLVEWQLRVAQGEKLPKKQEELAINGHAVEARIYAEDANSNFLPSTGKLVAMNLGANTGTENDNIRVDAGVEQGDEITPYYDPMIAKLIVHAPTRNEALDLLENRLKQARIVGPSTNISFLAKLCADPSFRKEHFDTSLIETKLDQLIITAPIDDATIALGISGLIARQNEAISARNFIRRGANSNSASPWVRQDGFQLSGERELDWDFVLNGEPQKARLRFDVTGIAVLSDDKNWIVPAQGGHVYHDGEKTYVLNSGRQSIFEPFIHELREEGFSAAANGEIFVPMHGKIISVTVANGDEVEEGDILFSVEAMKMEHSVLAPVDGVIEGLAIKSGAQVEAGFVALRGCWGRRNRVSYF